ncbi:MAG TPA: amidohydrolase family protein [Herpetosiphonaceae bacterium]|nr:amidohydrolase family protein [Herpetosiphonaceae bacterium]
MARMTLPGLIDVHVHLRQPGGEQKETYATGTAAALAGGVTTVLDMPNTSPPTVDPDTLEAKRRLAAAGARCDVGLYLGATVDNMDHVAAAAAHACGLKIYVSATFGPLRVADWARIEAHVENWPPGKPIVVHCEGALLPHMLQIGERHGRHIHVAHVALREEIEAIIEAKSRGAIVSCEVTPHHLIFSAEDLPRLGPFGDVRPRIASPNDRAALWEYLDVIDCVATDHAPHTFNEKRSDSPPPGLPGLQTMLPLLLTAVDEGRFTLDRLTELTVYNPARLFGLKIQDNTSVEVEIGPRYQITNGEQLSKCGWTPFAGMEVAGRVLKTVLRGKTVWDGEKVLAEPGSGRVLW